MGLNTVGRGKGDEEEEEEVEEVDEVDDADMGLSAELWLFGQGGEC